MKLTVVRIAGCLLSPTWALAAFVKSHRPDGGTKFIWRWNWAFFALSIGTILVLSARSSPVSAWWVLQDFKLLCLWIYLWFVPFSRSNEIFFAILEDAFDQLEGQPPRTSFKSTERLQLAMRSYVEVMGDSAILDFLLPSSWFSRSFQTPVDAFYFSGIAITTVGFGDITPCHPLSKLLVLYEVLIGIALVVITFGTYIGRVKRRDA